MIPFDNLTRAGKLRRLHALAQSALASFDLADPALELHCLITNVHYRVTTRHGQRFVLRLGHPAWRTLSDLQSEAMWLEALARDTDVGAPQVVRARDGQQVFALQAPGVPQPRHVTLMTWVPGRILGRHLSARNLEGMGVLFAQLHHHGKAWTPPAGFTERRFEHWLSRGEPNALLDPTTINRLPPPSQETILRLHRHVESAYARIDRADLRVIHCDLWHDNIKLHRGALHPFDFEDTTHGFRAHDIAMAMLDLLEDTDDDTYTALLAAFRRGYESLLAWPDDPIEPFQIGRLLWKMNYVARWEPQWLPQMVERHMNVFLTYERTGRVVKPPVP